MNKTTPSMDTQFVGREGQINIVEERVEIIQSGGSVFQVVINFYGVVGIGKTALLRELERRVDEQGLPHVFVNLEAHPEAQTFGPSNAAALVRAMTAQIAPSGPAGRSAEARELTPEHLDEWAGTFIEALREAMQSQGEPALLFFDTLEGADKEMVDWLEEALISPLIRTDRVLVVVASRAPHRWKRFEVRRRAYPAPLDPFDDETTRQQLPPSYTALAPEIIHLTRGHPYANAQVIESVQHIEQEADGALPPADFEAYQERLIENLVDGLIEDRIMEEVPAEIRRAYRVMALPRQFDVNVLRRLLTQFVEDPFQGKSAAYFLGVVGRMVKTTLVEWSSDRRGYVLDDTIRWMLALHMRLTDEARYVRIQRALIELYEEWIERVPENRSGFIIERLYHTACLLDAEGESASHVAAQLCHLLQRYLREYYPVRERLPAGEMSPDRTALQEELDDDEDIRAFLPPGEEDCLTALLRRASTQNDPSSQQAV
jgi:hypothetical protein